ncbi:cupin domain-containing protein [Agromyces aurantiacus]|uniref:Cupin domain-containing protein n=1 Tax=Agromyces aurantiacus TaxID=165814 RepID=A0ABV9R536_9MICO|nr:cupin domain-containing protein [Agromyces aurantiacus]MBM7503911.1 mannose-6-phosphate isomerase-like protein (cupin superfamily) [Agromyces aurantiacus]
MTRPAFPGATSISALAVYDGVAPDGLAGGAPHLHTVSAEAYLVVAGHGRLHTIDGAGTFAERPLAPGDLVWFAPGVIHRAVNDGGLAVRVIMQNAGLPEAGDAVMTFPDDVLADPGRYADAAELPGPDASDVDRLAAAHARRDLAVEGYLALFGDAAEDGGAVDRGRLARLHARAAALVRPRVPEWRDRWRDGAVAAALETGERLDALDAGRDAGMGAAGVAEASGAPDFGMCGRLRRYDTTRLDPTGGDR